MSVVNQQSKSMDRFVVKQTLRTPGVDFDATTGILELTGNSYMPHPKDFYEPIINDWLEKYVENPSNSTMLKINLDFINTSSSMWIISLLRKLDTIRKNKTAEVRVHWYFMDEDVRELGEEYRDLVSIPFKFVELNQSYKVN